MIGIHIRAENHRLAGIAKVDAFELPTDTSESIIGFASTALRPVLIRQPVTLAEPIYWRSVFEWHGSPHGVVHKAQPMVERQTADEFLDRFPRRRSPIRQSHRYSMCSLVQ